MSFWNLAFVMTDKCNAACKMCCFSCSPRKNTILNKERIKAYIKQAQEIGTFKTVAFTGGEAILYYEQLKECIQYANASGFNSTLVTNGFWAANYDRGYEMIKGLVEAGLTDISMSVDQYHQEFVKIETVKNAIKICDSFGVLSALTLMDLKDGRSSSETMEKLRPEIYGKELIIYPVFPAGEAVANIDGGQIIKACNKNAARCAFDKSITVLFDGTIMMCCSQFSREINMTHLGNYETTDLADAIKAFYRNDFLYVLLSDHFDWYVDLAEKMGMKVDDSYSVSCHLCHYLFTDREFIKAVRPLVKAEAERLRMKKLLSGNEYA